MELPWQRTFPSETCQLFSCLLGFLSCNHHVIALADLWCRLLTLLDKPACADFPSPSASCLPFPEVRLLCCVCTAFLFLRAWLSLSSWDNLDCLPSGRLLAVYKAVLSDLCWLIDFFYVGTRVIFTTDGDSWRQERSRVSCCFSLPHRLDYATQALGGLRHGWRLIRVLVMLPGVTQTAQNYSIVCTKDSQIGTCQAYPPSRRGPNFPVCRKNILITGPKPILNSSCQLLYPLGYPSLFGPSWWKHNRVVHQESRGHCFTLREVQMLLDLWRWLRPDNPIVNWKYPKSK